MDQREEASADRFPPAPDRREKAPDSANGRVASCVRLAPGRARAIRRANRAGAKRAPMGAGARAGYARIRVPPQGGRARKRRNETGWRSDMQECENGPRKARRVRRGGANAAIRNVRRARRGGGRNAGNARHAERPSPSRRAYRIHTSGSGGFILHAHSPSPRPALAEAGAPDPGLQEARPRTGRGDRQPGGFMPEPTATHEPHDRRTTTFHDASRRPRGKT